MLQNTCNSWETFSCYDKESCVFGSCFSAFLQALHFFIGFGALVSPLIADPFLSETGCGNHTENASETIHHFRNMLRNSPIVEHNINQSHMSHEDSNVQYAFWIMALINVRPYRSRCCCFFIPISSWLLFVHPQLPVPIAVLFLMYREQLIPCCPSGTPRLLDKDELAMETQQGAEGPDAEQKNHEAGGERRGGQPFLMQNTCFKTNTLNPSLCCFCPYFFF